MNNLTNVTVDWDLPAKQKARRTLENLRDDPWRFTKGQLVFVVGWEQDQPYEIIGRYSDFDWPHYSLRAPDGSKWDVAQIRLSTQRISNRD